MAADHFCLKWNNYQSNMVSELDSLRSDEDLVDVTLSCDGHQLRAHKVILSACSSYFRSVFKENPCKHPVIILKDVSYDDVEALLSFVYQGVVYISEKKLSSFLQTAELLQIRGLAGAASTVKKAACSENVTTNQATKVVEKPGVPPPPQLLTANLVNSWKQQSIPNNVAPCSSRATFSSPTSPIPAAKRKKNNVNSKLSYKENIDDSFSNQDLSDTESDGILLPTVKSESTAMSGTTDECSIEELREDSSVDANPSFYEMESDDDAEVRNASLVHNNSSDAYSKAGDIANVNATFPNILNMMNYSPTALNSSESSASGSEARLGRRPCPLCQKIISNKSNLLKHMRIRHSDEYNPARCTMCGKVFKNKYSLRAHVNIYHKENTSLAHQGPNDFVNSLVACCSNDYGMLNNMENGFKQEPNFDVNHL